MYLRSLSYCPLSGTVRYDRSPALQPASPRSRGVCRAYLRASCCVVTHNPAVLQLDDTVSIRRISFGVRHLNDRGTRVIQPLEQLHDLITLRRVQISCRLVSENQFWIEDHGSGDSHKLLLAAGQLVWKKILLAHDVETIERVAHQADALFVRHVLVGQRHFQVFENRQIVDQVVALEDKADVRFMQLVAFLDVELVNGVTKKVIVPGPSTIQHADDTQQRRLPGARRAHDGDELARLNIQSNSAQQEEFVRASFDCLFETSQLNQRFHVGSLRFER